MAKEDYKAWEELKAACKEVEELKARLREAEESQSAAETAEPAGSQESTATIEKSETDGAAGSGTAGGKDAAPEVSGHDMLAVGSVYEGDIAIPGIAQGLDSSDSEGENASLQGRQLYTLEVLRTEVDEFGQPCILGKHAAYGDEQMCHLFTSADGCALNYADGETQCSGAMDLKAGTIAGKVCQLQQGEEGFYVPSTEVTHTFRLKLHRSSATERAARAALIGARERRLQLLITCIVKKQGGDNWSELQEMKLDSTEILTDVMDAAEAVCALFRRQASLLQGLKFSSVAHRETTIAELAAKGLSRASAHALGDTALTSFTIVNLIDREGPNRPDVIQELFYTGCRKAHERLGLSFHRLDKSLQSAEQRLAQEDLAGWRGEAEGEEQCMICLLELEKGEGVLRLPCGHMFHDHCGTEWLHTHTTCPNCRLEVGKEAEEAAAAAA
eukprot:CAMPEP_0177694908 /NCGR_PEP_ID=MMETSP0484_2-20121128/3179_1 /TAXON_ID=354590 /ORGANISM="Rhodomonas lens, Strain RHODO" /LENGTH=443 /DNA_ID=CAMNT_0019205807 /DNA_START=31 /DNA_END=1359 /DNA_ORIENTATION=+